MPPHEMNDIYQVGLARRVITPDKPMYMAGFGARTHPSEGVLHDLWTKALAIEDQNGARVVIVTTDIIGVTDAICEEVAAHVRQSHGLERKQLVFNASHTHSGPVIGGALETMFEMDDEHKTRVRDYTQHFIKVLSEAIGEALDNLQPSQLWFGHDHTTFAVNRRQPTPNGIINGYNPEGPSDHDVPVLKITTPDGTLRAMLFGYACHTTSVTSEFYVFCGDWAGFAQIDIEKKFPGAQAMFVQGCGADQNPLPRGTIEQSQGYGAMMAEAVARALDGEMKPVRGPITAALVRTDLELQPHAREMFEARLHEDSPHNPWRLRHAQLMLQNYDSGNEMRALSYPVQAVAFGNDLTILTMAGEVVIDYVLRVKREFGAQNIMVVGYTNDIMAYIPSLRVLREGGYEGGDAMIYFGHPAPFAENVEDKIWAAIEDVMNTVGRAKIA